MSEIPTYQRADRWADRMPVLSALWPNRIRALNGLVILVGEQILPSESQESPKHDCNYNGIAYCFHTQLLRILRQHLQQQIAAYLRTTLDSVVTELSNHIRAINSQAIKCFQCHCRYLCSLSYPRYFRTSVAFCILPSSTERTTDIQIVNSWYLQRLLSDMPTDDICKPIKILSSHTESRHAGVHFVIAIGHTSVCV